MMELISEHSVSTKILCLYVDVHIYSFLFENESIINKEEFVGKGRNTLLQTQLYFRSLICDFSRILLKISQSGYYYTLFIRTCQ